MAEYRKLSYLETNVQQSQFDGRIVVSNKFDNKYYYEDFLRGLYLPIEKIKKG